jgi:hypothetical protein
LRYFDLTPNMEGIAMLKHIHSIAGAILFSSGWRVTAVLGLAASLTLALTGTSSAEPPSPCFFGYGF